MALKGIIKKNEEDKESFVATFDNGTLAQLKELAVFLEKQGFSLSEKQDKQLTEVIRLSIASLERIKIKE